MIETVDIKAAREQLAADGVYAERLTLSGARVRPLRRSDRAVLYRELASLVEAGLPVVQSLDTLIEAPELAEGRVFLAGVRDAIKEGATLAAALERASAAVTPFELAMLDTAERSGSLGQMLGRLADVLEEQEQLHARVVSALVYPAIVMAAGVCVAGVMLGVLLPRTRAFLLQSRIELPALTRAMLAVGRFLSVWGLPVAALLAAALYVAGRRLRTHPETRRRVDARLFRLPLFGRGYRLLVALRFSRTLAVLLRAGVSMIDGVVLAGRATGSPWTAALAERASEAVRHGARLSDAVAGMPPLADALPGWIRVGEVSGGLAALLHAASERYRGQWERYVARGLSLLEPALVLAIGGFVLLVALSVLLPVLDLTRAMGR